MPTSVKVRINPRGAGTSRRLGRKVFDCRTSSRLEWGTWTKSNFRPKIPAKTKGLPDGGLFRF